MNNPTSTDGYRPTGRARRISPRLRGWLITGGALLVGIGLGALGAGDSPAPAAAPAPAPSPEVREVEKIVEVPVQVDVVPQACLDALNHGEAGFEVASETIGHLGEALGAAASYDAAGIEAVVPLISENNAELESLAPQWNTAKAECRAAGQ